MSPPARTQGRYGTTESSHLAAVVAGRIGRVSATWAALASSFREARGAYSRRPFQARSLAMCAWHEPRRIENTKKDHAGVTGQRQQTDQGSCMIAFRDAADRKSRRTSAAQQADGRADPDEMQHRPARGRPDRRGGQHGRAHELAPFFFGEVFLSFSCRDFKISDDFLALAVIEFALLDQMSDQPASRAVENVLDELADQPETAAFRLTRAVHK